MTDTGTTETGQTDGGDKSTEGEGEKFTQADVDRKVQEEVDRVVRKKAEDLYKRRVGDVDIDDLKKRAGDKATADERIANLEKEITATKHEALKRRVQAEHSISNEDADLFLTGADEESLTTQAKRLAVRESERKKQGNKVPNEGKTSSDSQKGSSWAGVLAGLDAQKT